LCPVPPRPRSFPDTCERRLLEHWGKQSLPDPRVSVGLWKKSHAKESHLQFLAEQNYLSEIRHREKYCKLKMREKKNSWIAKL